MTASKLVRIGALIALPITAVWAQVGAPVLGYLPSGGRLMPVTGIAASASVAPALDFGADFHQIAVSPRQDFALVSDLSSGTVMLAYPTGKTTALAATAAYPSSITLSPSGSAAVLWFASEHLLEIVSGLPATPLVRSVNAGFLTGASGDLPSALAISDDGAWGAGAWPSGVWAFGPNGEVRSLLAGERGFALAFYPGLQNLLVATRSGISSIADVGGSAAVSALYSSDGEVPVGLAVTADSQQVVLAEQRGNIVEIAAGNGAATTSECGCAPEGVFPMGGSIFRITGLTGSVFRVFDARAGSIFQIPLLSGAQGSRISAVPAAGRTGGELVTGGIR